LLFLFFLAKIEKIFSNNSPSQVVIYAKFGKKNLRARIYARSYSRRIRPYQKRWKGIKIILFLSQVRDVSYIWVCQVNYVKLLEMSFFLFDISF
jgi:hypothetical protein